MIKQTIQLLSLLVSFFVALQMAPVAVLASSAPTTLTIPDTTFTIKGYASPAAFVEIFDGDALIGTTLADSNGVYKKIFPAMQSGLHNFRIQYEDLDGVLSDTIGQTINIKPQSDTAVEYFLPPTISVSPDYIDIGKKITFLGSTTPNTQLEIVLDGGALILRPQSDASGRYSISVDTTGYYLGEHSIRVTSFLGGLQSYQTSKIPFVVVPKGSTGRQDTESLTLTQPSISNGKKVSTQEEVNLLRGEAPPYSQILIYVDGELIGSTFADGDGLWFFNLRLRTQRTEVKVVACYESKCSDPSDPSEFIFTGVFGRCNSFEFLLSNYRFYKIKLGDGITTRLAGITGKVPYEVLIDWGDTRTERFNLDANEPRELHHVYDSLGQFNGSVTMLDNTGCEYTRYFSVGVVERGIDMRLIYAASISAATMTIFIFNRLRNNAQKRRYAR